MRISIDSVCLTPPDFMGGPIGLPMAGYTPVARVKYVHDHIFARAVLIETTVKNNIGKYFLVISTDFCQMPLILADYIKEKIEKKYMINRNSILIHATHTHKSVDLVGLFTDGGNYVRVIRGIIMGAYKKWYDKYKVWMASRITEMVGRMLKNLRPAEIAWKQIIPEKILAVNRRTYKRAYRPLGVIVFRDKETHEKFGAIVNFGAHPTTLGHRDSFMSADYPGQVIETVEKLSGGKIKCVFFTGAAGDVSPAFGAVWAEKISRIVPKGIRPRRILRSNPFLFTKYYGELLGETAYRLIREAGDADFIKDAEIKVYTRVFSVPTDDYKKHKGSNGRITVTNRLVYAVKRLIFRLAVAMGDSHEPNFPGFALKHKKGKIRVYSQIQLAFISDRSGKDRTLCILGVPGELFEHFADRFRKMLKGNTVMIFQSSNDWIAYLFPLDDYIEHGGYESLASSGPLCGTYVYIYLKWLLEEINLHLTGGYY